jgi:hypothetical protein
MNRRSFVRKTSVAITAGLLVGLLDNKGMATVRTGPSDCHDFGACASDNYCSCVSNLDCDSVFCGQHNQSSLPSDCHSWEHATCGAGQVSCNCKSVTVASCDTYPCIPEVGGGGS